jgi:hypothetical protein
MFRFPLRLLILFTCTAGLWSTAPAQTKAVGPVLKIIPDPIHFDSVYCRQRMCQPITFRNIGDTTLVVHNLDKINRPFYARIDTPFTLQPGEAKTFEYCYTPLTWSRDSQRVSMRVDSRVPMSIGMLFDVSFSMITMMPDGKKRVDGTNAAGREFVGHLLDTLGIEDEAAVFTFDATQNFKLVQAFTKDTAALRAAIPAVVTGTSTCTYNAIARVIDSLRNRSNARFVVILTDGDDSGPTCGSISVDDVLRKAAETNTRVYVVTIGNVDQSDLSRIANATGGAYFNAGNSLDLLAIYRRIATELSKNNVMDFRTRGTAIGPRIEIEPKDLQFDSVRVGQTKCLPITVRNGGNSPLHADSVRKLFTPPYALHDLIPEVILPYQTVPAMLCFSPTLPRDYTQAISFLASPCEVFHDTIRAGAQSYLLPRVIPPRPILSYTTPVFDTTLCRTTECLELVFRNTGDTILTIQSVDAVEPPFIGNIPAPFSIEPDGERRFTVCYYPEEAPRDDTLRLGFEAELRPPQHIGLLFEEGREMEEEFLPGVSRLTAAVSGASDFIDGLLFDEDQPDYAAILRFSSGVPLISTGMLADRAALQAALRNTSFDKPSCLYDAVEQAVDSIATSSGARKLLLFTSGVNATSACGDADAQRAGQRAAAKGVPIIAIQLGDADSSDIAHMVALSGGEYYRPGDLFDLILTLRDLNTRMTGLVRSEMHAVAHAVTPIVTTSVTEIDFGTADTSAERKSTITIYNTGTAPLRIPLSNLLTPPFHIDSCLIVDIDTLPRVGLAVDSQDTLVIMPGDSITWCLAFAPLAPGHFFDTLTLVHNGCVQPELRIPFRGYGIGRPAADWKYPTALIIPTEAVYTVPCGPKKCEVFTFRNPGAVGNLMRFIRTPEAPWSLAAPDSLLIPAGGTADAELCFDPARGGESRDSIIVESFVRPQFGIVVLLARDTSMNTMLPDGLTADDAALVGVRILRDNFRTDTTDGDVLQVYSMGEMGPEIGIEYTGGGSREGRWPPPAPSGKPVPLHYTLQQAIDIAARLEGSRHVVLLASDIDAESAFDALALAARAASEGVQLHHFLFAPGNRDSLREYARLLWSYGEYSTLPDMSAFLHAATMSGLDVKRDTIRLLANVQSPMLEIEPAALSFGTVTVGGDRCLPVTLRNTGSAPLRISHIINPADPAAVDFPDEIAPNSQTTISLCFATTRFGEAAATALIVYDGCPLDTVRILMTAFGSDSLTVGISGEFVGKPGSVVHIPVQLYAQLPEEYDVHNIEITVQHNKTMLYPLDARSAQEGTVMGVQQVASVTMVPSFEDSTVSTRYRFTRVSPLNNLTPGAVMLRLPYLVLLGDALRTPLRITDIRFNEGLPRAGVAVNGVFRVDSLCFIEQRLIDSGNRVPAKITGVSPNPFNGSTVIAVDVHWDCDVRLTVLDIMGRVVAEPTNTRLIEGRYLFTVDAVSWPSGVYLCRLVAGGHVHTVRMTLTR